MVLQNLVLKEGPKNGDYENSKNKDGSLLLLASKLAETFWNSTHKDITALL